MPVFWDSISFLWALAVVAAIAIIFGLRTGLAYWRLPREAAEDWDYQVSQNMQDLRLSKESYVQIYKRVNAPRAALYVTATFTAILILTPVAFSLINSVLWSLWNSSTEPVEIKIRGGVRENIESLTYEPGNMVWGFFTFFGIVAIWALIGAFAARRYYKAAPGRMRDELIYARAEFEPDQALTVGANPAHIMAMPSDEDDIIPSREAYAKVLQGGLGLSRDTDKNYMGSGHICDIYTDGSDNRICVHTVGDLEKRFEQETHPFFFAHEHAREDDKRKIYTIIRAMPDIDMAFAEIEKSKILIDKSVGSAGSRMRSFQHENIEVFLYRKR